MPSHSDALGYLNDLAKEVDEPWFQMVCDLAGVSRVSTLDPQTLETLFALYTKKTSYLGIKPASIFAAAAPPASSTDFLEELSGFTNFKLLGDTLQVCFKKRITVVFGANGSGKSSLCESLKALANPELPNRPLHNLRGTGTAAVAFRYKFKSDSAARTWTQTVGYGRRRGTVKYFDTGIAIKNVKAAVEPGRVIILTPFKLHVFAWATALTTEFREALQQTKQVNSEKITQALEAIRTEFAKFEGRPLAAIDERTLAVLAAQIIIGEGFLAQHLLTEKQTAAAELEKAGSEEGLKLLKAEHRELEAFLTSLGTLLDLVGNLWALEPATKVKTLAAKLAEQEVLAKTLIPTDGTLESLLTLLRAASRLCKLEAAADQVCPLCKRNLNAPEVDLFKQYYELLAGELEKDTAALKADIARAEKFTIAVGNVNRKEWDRSATLRAELLTSAKTASDLIVASCDTTKEPTEEAKGALESLRGLSVTWAQQLELKAKAIGTTSKGREELIRQLTKLRAEIETLEYAQFIHERLEKLKDVQRMAAEAEFWERMLPSITPLLKKITDTAKRAHEELVVMDFERCLNAEYNALTEKDMTAFGVTLARKGSDASVTVLPQIGGKEIESVLSEGEQRVHALALFFAELETCPQSALVFDDPISSFDYNYIANYCARLRDLALNHPGHQIIVLTHNWEFFVQLQTTVNSGGLNSDLSVQVLENCSIVADYSEKLDELKADITAVLALPSEPTKAQKEDMAGKMRRLIEAVVNTHVFNNQRQQYKQRKHSVSEFQHYTKLVRLETAEATTLRDLYAKLSITEHDDVRNAYVNTDKATFQSRYSAIVAVENAVISRK